VSEYTDEDRAIGWEVIRQLGEPADPAQCAYERLIATAAAGHAREVYAERIKALEAALSAWVEEECDYMRRNNLGNPEMQHNVIWSRALLKEADQ
jgi:hypothetical protein